MILIAAQVARIMFLNGHVGDYVSGVTRAPYVQHGKQPVSMYPARLRRRFNDRVFDAAPDCCPALQAGSNEHLSSARAAPPKRTSQSVLLHYGPRPDSSRTTERKEANLASVTTSKDHQTVKSLNHCPQLH